ncbi:MAG: hypothetical protein JRI86_11380 [Deltaproteobacteria bacterium]|nr:hypothetical protein [Deltaproteobacteria bacterium]
MVSTVIPQKEDFWLEDPFLLIKQEEFNELGINPADIPPGTLAARKHPPQLTTRFGGNAYGFGFFEIYDRLGEDDIKLLQSISLDDPDQIKKHYIPINLIYKRIGLLIRFSSLGTPYFLIPVHLVSTTLTTIKNKADEISKVIDFHRKKFLKERSVIGILTYDDDPVINNLSIRYTEHQFVIINSIDKLHSLDQVMDLVILPRDIHRILLMKNFISYTREGFSHRELQNYTIYLLGKIYRLLKPAGEIFIIANRYPSKTNLAAKITFKTEQEQKNFLIFTHIFKTRKRYTIQEDGTLRINVFDLERYLGDLYVEQEIVDKLFDGHTLEDMTIEEINGLPYLDNPLKDDLAYDQEKVWPGLFSTYFTEIFHKPLIPESIKEDHNKRFAVEDYSPDYMFIHLAEKQPIDPDVAILKNELAKSPLSGCPLPFLAEYRDSFSYLLRTLDVLNRIKSDTDTGLPELFMGRLREPLEDKKKRYECVSDVLELMDKKKRLERIIPYLNPDMIEGTKTRVLENLEALSFFGFSYGELSEIYLIVVGHTSMGRILSGKMHERTLKPVSNLAKSYSTLEGINLLRYCRLMCMAETVASQKADMNQAQLAELFDLFNSMVRVMMSPDLDWDTLLDEKIASTGGIHNWIIRKLLVMMMNSLEFLDNWAELRDKGEMEKESLADYDPDRLSKIENIISLIKVIEQFENRFLKDDPLQLPIVYRKFLNMEFHGTGYIFERMNGHLVFVLLWVTINVARDNETINFNTILSGIRSSEIDSQIEKVEQEAARINVNSLELDDLKQFSEQLYKHKSAFIMDTGFNLKLDHELNSIDVTYIDMDKNIAQLDALVKRLTGCKISDVTPEELEEMECLFSDLEDFYQGHLRLPFDSDVERGVPQRQKIWYENVHILRNYLKENFVHLIFDSHNIYTNLDLLYRYCPSVLRFALPELMALEDLNLPGMIYLRSNILGHIFKSLRKIQALIRRDEEDFQDFQASHKLAQLEFGPMTAGIVGLNEFQVETLEAILDRLSNKRHLFNALIKSFIFQDLGITPALREKYFDQINAVDQAQAGALFIENEKISSRYNMDKEEERYLIFLVRYHDRILHIARGEFSRYSMLEIIDLKDRDLFDAFFVSSFVMFSALGEDMVFEDLADRLFTFMKLCHSIINGETTLDNFTRKLFALEGRLFYCLKEYQEKGLLVVSMERIFRMRGLRYAEFSDLVYLLVGVPLKYVYRKKNYTSIGYGTFEKEVFEARSIYKGIRNLPENVQDFILSRLAYDQVRIFGFENVNRYLNYENLIKLLLIALLGSTKFKKDGTRPVCLDFLSMSKKIGERYEVLNNVLSKMEISQIWDDQDKLNQFKKPGTGIVLKREASKRILQINFIDEIDISRKISHMKTITDVDSLKDYHHSSLQTLKNSPFHTEDYGQELKTAFNARLEEIINLMLIQARKQMVLLKDFKEIHHLFTNLMEKSEKTGFSADQKERLNDIYEVRKDHLKREKLEEISCLMENVQDMNELKACWDGSKHYLQENRIFLGKEFETLVARMFDQTAIKIKAIT